MAKATSCGSQLRHTVSPGKVHALCLNEPWLAKARYSVMRGTYSAADSEHAGLRQHQLVVGVASLSKRVPPYVGPVAPSGVCVMKPLCPVLRASSAQVTGVLVPLAGCAAGGAAKQLRC